MKIKALVVAVSDETWFKGTRDERAVCIPNLLDAEAHDGILMKNTFDYSPGQEDAGIEWHALVGKPIVFACREIKQGQGGRLKMSGKVDRSSLPTGNGPGGKANPSGTATKP